MKRRNFSHNVNCFQDKCTITWGIDMQRCDKVVTTDVSSCVVQFSIESETIFKIVIDKQLSKSMQDQSYIQRMNIKFIVVDILRVNLLWLWIFCLCVRHPWLNSSDMNNIPTNSLMKSTICLCVQF